MIIDNIIDAKAHLGTLKSRSNPKTRSYWLTVTNGVVVLNPEIICSQLENARNKVQKAKKEGKKILVISEKVIFNDEIESIAEKNGYSYLNYKVPGGILTNFETLLLRVKSMNELKNYVESEEFQSITKKEKLMKLRQLKKVEMVYKGVKNLKNKPDLVIIVDGKYMGKFVDELVKTNIDNIVISSTDFNRWWDENCLVMGNVNFYESLKLILEYILN